jgi:hypothetical protein
VELAQIVTHLGADLGRANGAEECRLERAASRAGVRAVHAPPLRHSGAQSGSAHDRPGSELCRQPVEHRRAAETVRAESGESGDAQQAWAPAVAPPMARPSAAWNVPVISAFVPHTALPALIWNAWADPFVRPPAPVAIAPLTLAPPIITSVPFVAPSYAIVRAWQEDPSRLQRLVTIAPLTLVYGQQPPVQPPLSAASRLIILQAWPADLEPRLQRPNDQQNKIAPLTLTYGTRPPVRAPLSIASRIIIAAWPADLEPRLTRPNADRAGGPTWLNIPPLWTFGPLVEIHDVSVVVNSGLSNVSARAASLSDVSGEGA